MRLAGFKSFVDAADLRIEPGLTGIVGPNGCGKSNLLEALRWAMGENSPKSMRGAGMEDVIFAGTESRPRRDFAEVQILAEQTGGEEDEELEVVRRIERGAGSAYRINGRDVRAKDVALLFADAATGAHSPALVSQGRISAVIAAKPGERRQMLEEAAGISGLHVRRRDAEQRLRATEANLARLDEVIADQEARAAALKRQARQAERYRRLTDDIRVAEARMIYARWRDAAAAAEIAKREAAEAEERVLERAEAERAAVAHQHAATQTLGEARSAALAARDAAAESAHTLQTLRTEQDTLTRRIADLHSSRERLADDRTREGELASDAAAAIARLEEEGTALTRRIDEASARIPDLDQALAAAESASRDAEVALAQALAEQAREAAEKRVAEAALTAARARLDRADRDLARSTAELDALAQPGPLETELTGARQARTDAETRIAAAQSALEQAEQARETAVAEQSTAQSARAAAHAELAALDSEARALEKALHRTAGGDKLLDALTAEPGYERALAAALGDDLEAGQDSTAERFWAMTQPRPDDPAPPPGLTMLAEHVDAPALLTRRLRQIVVAETDDGQPLAVGQRLVTLAGSLRRWDGYVARSGGAAAAERLERRNRLTALEKARPAAQQALETADSALETIGQAIAAARQAIERHRHAIATAETQLRDAIRAEDRAAAALERIAAQRSDLEQRLARVREDHDAAQAELTVAQANAAALPDDTQTGARVETLGQTAEARRAAAATARADRTTLDRQIAQDRERAAAVATEVRNWKARAGEAARRITDMDKRAAAIDAEAETIRERPDTLATAIAAAETAQITSRATADAAQAKEAEAEAALRRTEEAVRTTAEALAQAREARAGANARAENQDARRIEMGRVAGERFECPPPVLPKKAGFESDGVGTPEGESRQHEKLVLDRERIGPVNLIAERELEELEHAGATNAAEREELGQAVNRLRGSIGTLNREGRQRLLAAFKAVDRHFQRLFSTLFNGGAAHLEMIDSDDPLEAGLEIMAQPPGKKLQSLTLLSGGEQALTAVALIFALFLTNPAPICVLDEVDAPLDDANIDRFCDLLDRMTRETETRYLIVTHNAATMSRMHRLFGVTMVERGVSRLVSVDLGGAEDLLAAE
nr:chromosome segregation protein SMC [Stakelama sediminis]